MESLEVILNICFSYVMALYGPIDSYVRVNQWGLGVECDGLYGLVLGSGIVVRCGLVGVGVSLWVWAFRPSL